MRINTTRKKRKPRKIPITVAFSFQNVTTSLVVPTPVHLFQKGDENFSLSLISKERCNEDNLTRTQLQPFFVTPFPSFPLSVGEFFINAKPREGRR